MPGLHVQPRRGCLFFFFGWTQIVFFNPLLDDILYQQGNAPLFATCIVVEDLLGFLICTKRNILNLFHIDHPYTSYTFSLDESMNTL